MPLLPSGLQDTLPPAAALDRHITNVVLDRFALFGYEQVAPPLLEFEDSLLAGKGAAHATNTFRVMDPESQRMMGLRPDITPQIERLALTMLDERTPISRLSYSGQVLRVAPDGLSTKRQLRQAGIELIGMTDHIHPLEPLTAAIEGLSLLGLSSMVVSLSSAGLFDALLGGCLDTSQASIRKAIYQKDTNALPASMPYKELVIDLLTQPIAEVLETHTLPHAASSHIDMLQSLASALSAQFGDTLRVLIDPLDTEGFDYHDGTCFTLMDAESRQELGRGGQYSIDHNYAGCGLTLYVDRLVDIVPTPQQAEAQTVSPETSYQETKQLRDQGIATHYTYQN